MADIKQLIALVEEKHQLFLAFEIISEEMLSCATDSLEAFVAEREGIVNKIDMVDLKIQSAVITDADLQAVMDIIGGRMERGELNGAEGALYDAAAAVRADILRIMEMDTQVVSRMVIEQERLVEMIKETNRGAGAKAARFNAGGGAGQSAYHITDA